MDVVIRYIDTFNRWYICHRKSYQNAFRKSDGNEFESRAEAVAFAQSKDCKVFYDENDQLQRH